MKIKKLIITGFGPYASRQELDFEKNLKDKNMFVITGNTGAGKTTIFDAINFALYGEASGSDREGKSLRSDFAYPQTPTEVELLFSLRGKDYCVKRSPAYLRLKQRGEGFIESKPTAEIKLSKDKTVTGTKEVTREIEKILGITTEQFKQLVMIPQGEFKRLLNAESDKKEDIFRKIFGTEIFERIQKEIKEQANGLKKSIEQVERDRLNKIKSFNCKDKDEELFRIINADKPNIEFLMKKFYEFIERDKVAKKEVESKIEEKNIFVDKILKEIALGEANNKKFDNLQKNKEVFYKLNEQLEIFENKKVQVERAKKALNVKSYEDKFNDKKVIVKALEGEIKSLEDNLRTYKESYIKAEQDFHEQKAKEEERNQLNKEIEENKRLKDKVSLYETNKRAVDNLYVKVKEIKDRIKKINMTNLENDKKIELINNELEEIKKAKEEKGSLEINELNCKNKKENLEKLIKDIDLWIKGNEKYEKSRVSFDKIEKSFKESREKYEFLEDSFKKNQAGILANNLKEGTPCPVCGSIHHPSLAKIENSEITEVAVNLSKEILEKTREERDKKLQELRDINSSSTLIKNNSIDPLVKKLLNKEAVKDVLEIKNEVDKLIINNEALLAQLKNKIQDLFKIIIKENEKLKALKNLQNNNDALRNELQLKNEELVAEERKLSSAKTLLDNIKSEFKGEIKTLAQLETIAEGLNNKLINLKRSYEESEKAFNIIKGKLDQENGKYENAKQGKEKADKELEETLSLFKDKVISLGFKDYKDYKANCLTEEVIENKIKRINDFNITLAGAKTLYEASLKETEGLSIIDLGLLKEKLTIENNTLKDLNNERMEIFSRISNNTSLVEACENYNKKIEAEEKKYEIVGKLSNITNGDNPKKISFERYVLASYFEDIIRAANLRFNKMTSGRFELLRKQDIGDKRKGQGLDLEVFDNYTGKARDVKTLSGGESFKASLAMALGLADVVQGYAGGIQLDTMFIDEGFGTLDPESLDNAIECLMALQSDGRLVAIISHVPELKERISARLEVKSTNKGSRAEFRI